MTNDPGDTGSATLLVGVSNPATAHRLVQLSSILAATNPWQILLTHVVTVAEQISLTTGKSSPEVVRARDFLQEVQENAMSEGVKARALVEVARSVDEGLLAAAESHDAGMILVGYSEEGGVFDEREEERFDRTMQRVARKAEADVAVAKFRNEGIGRILVPVSTDGPLPVISLLSRALATAPGAELTFLNITDPDAQEGEVRKVLVRTLAEEGLTELGRIQVRASENPVSAILEESKGYDLVLVGPSQRPGFMENLFSSKSREIAEEAPVSVLLAWTRASVR